MSGGHGAEQGGGVRKMLIVLLLVGGVVLVHRFAVRTVGFDPSAMLALGFVILASYSFGQLVGRIGLPHLTGYILAGIALGPSAVHYLPPELRVAPFDQGVLNESVTSQLRVFETLAVALIALAAGGQLRLGLLRRGLVHLVGMISGHILIAGPIAFGILAAISTTAPEIRMPGLEGVPMGEALAMAAIVATVVIATSPAAAVAVVAETRAHGPVTEMSLAGVVLRDVFSVILFSIAVAVAGPALGHATAGNLGWTLVRNIGGSIIAGAVIGGVTIAYLRFIKAELLLFVTALVFTVAFVAQQLGVDPVLLFIVAGFVTVNFSSAGPDLLDTVERLFLPVSVVFFTLAGARLHLDILIALAPFAATIVGARALATFIGVRTGLAITGAPPLVRRYAWLAYIPQAGVALSLATVVGSSLGELGEVFETLLVGSIALNEIIGPALLKLGLSRSGELGGGGDHEAEAAAAGEHGDEPQPLPTPRAEEDDDAWGPPLVTGSAALDEAVMSLEHELDDLVQRASADPLKRFREEGLAFVRDLRREFLRHHRRITVQALAESPEMTTAEALRIEQAELADKWRSIVLARAAEVREQPTWDPDPILEAAESIADRLSPSLTAPYPEISFPPREDDSRLTALARAMLRGRRNLRRLFRRPMPPRSVELRALARWHFWGLLPEALEPVAAVHAQAEARLVGRTGNIFDGLVRAYDALAGDLEAAREEDEARPSEQGEQGEAGEAAEAEAQHEDDLEMTPDMLEERLRGVRRHVEQELMMAVQEVDRIVGEATRRTKRALGTCLRGLKDDAHAVGTPDLPMRRRAASTLYKRRDDARTTLGRGISAARDTSAALYNRLALELEMLALEGRVKNALDEHATTLGRDVRGRAHRQVERVQEAIATASERFEAAIVVEGSGGELSREIREACEPIVRVAAEASRVAASLRDQLTDERSMTLVLDVLTRAAQGLTDRYRIPAGPVQPSEDRLPAAIGTVDVPFREWVLARIETSLAPRLLAATREVAARVEPLAQSLSELERRMAFNLELATSELSVIEDEAPLPETRKLLRDMIGGALDRHRDLFAGYGETSERWGDEVRRGVRDSVMNGLEELRAGIAQGEMGRLRYQLVRDVRGRRVARFFRELRRSIARSWMIAGRALREGLGEARIDRVRARLGLPVRLAEEDIGEDTFTPKEPVASIPVVYRRLFSAQALEAGDILTGRDEALGRAMSVLEGRGNGALRTVALVGPDGVGKSAFVNAVVRARKWPKVRELALSAPATVEDVEELFERETEGHLVVISGVHWMRSLEPGGFAPLRRLVAGVVADGGKNAFLLRADALVWAQSAQAAPLEDAFPEIVRLDPLGPKGLEAAVIARHTVSGYGLVFNQGLAAESKLEEAVQKATAPLSRPQETFFRALHAASGGLLRDALRLWLSAVEHVDETTDFVHLGPVPAPSIYALRHLDEPQVLTLYQVARQGWMDGRVLASLFRTDETAAEAQLAALAHIGILQRRGGVWRIAVHLRGSIYRLLRERGYVA